MASQNNSTLGYDFGNFVVQTAPVPVISTRDPGARDQKQIGTLWINTEGNAAFVLTSVVANVATWHPI